MPRPTVSSKLRTVCFDRTRLPRPPYYFRGMALMAARRAKPVQRTCSQGLQGNRDACHLRRGSACDISAKGAGGNARLVFASSVQPTAAMSPRLGGAGGAPRPLLFPHFFGKKWGRPPRRRRPGVGPLWITHARRTCVTKRAGSVTIGTARRGGYARHRPKSEAPAAAEGSDPGGAGRQPPCDPAGGEQLGAEPESARAGGAFGRGGGHGGERGRAALRPAAGGAAQ